MYPVCLVPGQGLFPLQMRVPALAVGRSQGRGPACSTKPSGPSGLCCSPSLAHSPRPPAAPTCPSSPWEPLGLPLPLPHSGPEQQKHILSQFRGQESEAQVSHGLLTPPSDPGGQEGKSTLCQGSLGLHSAWPRHCPLLSVPCAALWAGIQAWGHPAQSRFLLCLNPEMHTHPGPLNPYSVDSASPPLWTLRPLPCGLCVPCGLCIPSPEGTARGVSEGPAVDNMPSEACEDPGGCEVAKAVVASRRCAPALTGHGEGPGGWRRGGGTALESSGAPGACQPSGWLC